MRRRLVLLALAAAAAGSAAAVTALLLAGAGGDGKPRRSLVVSATSEQRVRPDLATLSLGVTARAPTAQAAMRTASESLDAVVAAARRVGVAGLRTQPVRVRRPPVPEQEGEPPRPFVASQSVAVRVRELERLGELIDDAVDAGATDVAGPRFGLADPRALRRRGLARAVTNARRTGRAMAAAAGLRLGRAVRIAERAAGRPLPAQTSRDAAQAGSAPPIEPGTVRFTAAVTVTFAVSDA